jgi:hypothetical protein
MISGLAAANPLSISLCCPAEGNDLMQREGSASLSHLPAPCRGEATKPKRQPRASKRITMRQASNMIEAVQFAKSVGLSLVAHLTIHWAYTNVGDDPDGKLFAKVREGLAKWARRHGFPLTGIWARERMSGGQAEVVHCHLLFHLPVKYRMGARLLQVEEAIYRLIKKHGRRDDDKHGHGYWADEVIKLVIHDNPDGKYLIKGGGAEVWKHFRLRKEHRRLQGLIFGKRCGTTENVGPAARTWKKQQDRNDGVAAWVG